MSKERSVVWQIIGYETLKNDKTVGIVLKATFMIVSKSDNNSLYNMTASSEAAARHAAAPRNYYIKILVLYQYYATLALL